jgi:hypothetical protein
MPRAKSGNPPWPMIACKLPPEELEALRRYADIHRCSISEVLRQGLALKLADAAPVAPPPQHIPVDVLLKDALRHGMNCPQCMKEYASNGLTTTTESDVSRLTSPDTLESNGLTSPRAGALVQNFAQVEPEVSRLTPLAKALDDIPTPAEEVSPTYDTARLALGRLCPKPGHEYQDSGQSLRELRNGTPKDCHACHQARGRASSARRAKRAKAT